MVFIDQKEGLHLVDGLGLFVLLVLLGAKQLFFFLLENEVGSRWDWIERGTEGSDESLDDPEDSRPDLRGGEEEKPQRQTGSDLIVLRKMKEDEGDRGDGED